MKKMNKSFIVKCRTCGIEFDLTEAEWCDKHFLYGTATKLCPNGHCICNELKERQKWRLATPEEKKYGFELMLREQYGGVKK